MSNDTQHLREAYAACVAEVLRQAPMLIERWCSEVCAGLNQRSQSSLQSAEQRRLKSAILALRSHQTGISDFFSAELSKAIASQPQLPSSMDGIEPVATPSTTSFDDLQLMGDDEVQDSVVTARLMESVAMACDSGLAAFSARLSTAQGFAQVKVDDNPFRPKIFSNALLKAVQAAQVEGAMRPLWLMHGGAVMGQLVQALYLRLNELLIRRGVAPAAYRVITQKEGSPLGQNSGLGLINSSENSTFGHSAFSAGAFSASTFSASAFSHYQEDAGALPTIDFPERPTEANPSRSRAPSRVQSTVNRLRRLFGSSEAAAGNAVHTSNAEPTVHPDFGHTLPEALSALDELQADDAKAPSTVSRTMITAPPQLVELRAQLKTAAKSVGQSLALEVVTLMIEKITSDARLLLSVREVIATFEPAYLRLAVKDPRFFRDQSHPARRLLETITTKSLAYPGVTAPGFNEFMQDLLSTAGLLTGKKAPDAQHFATLLMGFDKQTKTRADAARGRHSLTAPALVQAEQSKLMAKKIAIEIAARPDFAANNDIVAEFLLGVWSQVMAKERLLVDADKTGARKAIFSLTLGELLWSLNSEKTALNRKRLAKLIPNILERVQGGLLSINSPLADSEAFFNEMLAIHQSALDSTGKPAAAGTTREKFTQDSQRKPDIDSLFCNHDVKGRSKANGTNTARGRPGRQADTEQHSRSNQEISIRPAGGFQGTQPFFDTDAAGRPPVTRSAVVPAVVVGDTELHLGAWIELAEDNQWTRAQLTWISQYKTLFIFISADGRTHSMAGPLLEFLLLQGRLRVISQAGVLAGALEGITRSAMRNNARAGEQASRQ